MINIIDGEFMRERTTIDLDGSEKKKTQKSEKHSNNLKKRRVREHQNT